MKKSAFVIPLILISALIVSCGGNKPKPESDTVGNTSVAVNGEKDSVINNPLKNYGNATIAEPCIKCLLQTVQADEHYKQSVPDSSAIKFVVNYVKTAMPEDTTNETKATNALRVDVIGKEPSTRKISSYLYDNSTAKLYFINGKTITALNTDSIALKKIRNSCYWGVASGK